MNTPAPQQHKTRIIEVRLDDIMELGLLKQALQRESPFHCSREPDSFGDQISCAIIGFHQHYNTVNNKEFIKHCCSLLNRCLEIKFDTKYKNLSHMCRPIYKVVT